MTKVVGIMVGMLMAVGCAHYEYGDVKVTSVLLDPKVDQIHAAKIVESNGMKSATALDVTGFQRVGGETGSHVLGNVACTLIGAVFGGATAGPGGAVVGASKGAAAGAAAGEIWQNIADWWQKGGKDTVKQAVKEAGQTEATTNSPAADKPSAVTPAEPVTATGPLVDPPRMPDGSEEARIEPQVGVPARIKVWYPSVGKWWEPYNEVRPHVKPDDDRTVQVENWVENGYAWTVLGGRNDEPPDGDPNPPMDVTGNRHLPRNVCIHVRKVP